MEVSLPPLAESQSDAVFQDVAVPVPKFHYKKNRSGELIKQYEMGREYLLGFEMTSGGFDREKLKSLPLESDDGAHHLTLYIEDDDRNIRIVDLATNQIDILTVKGKYISNAETIDPRTIDLEIGKGSDNTFSYFEIGGNLQQRHPVKNVLVCTVTTIQEKAELDKRTRNDEVRNIKWYKKRGLVDEVALDTNPDLVRTRDFNGPNIPKLRQIVADKREEKRLKREEKKQRRAEERLSRGQTPQPENILNQQQRKRRDLLVALASIPAAAGLASLAPLGAEKALNYLANLHGNPLEQNPSSSEGHGLPEDIFTRRDEIITAAEAFMDMSITDTDNRRDHHESELVDVLSTGTYTLSDIRLAMSACVTRDARTRLMNLISTARENHQLPPSYCHISEGSPLYIWAQNNKISPDALAIAVDVRQTIKDVLVANAEDFFEANALYGTPLPTDVDIDRFVPNAGVLAALSMLETSGLLNVGTGNADQEFNPHDYPTGPKYIKILAESLNAQNTGLKYTAKTIPGSEWPSNERSVPVGSGGAIGAQIMPLEYVWIFNAYNKARDVLKDKYPDSTYPDLNPWDPFTMMMGYGLFLSMHTRLRVGELDRKGNEKASWDIPSHPDRYNTLRDWNDDPTEINAVLAAGDSFQRAGLNNIQ